MCRRGWPRRRSVTDLGSPPQPENREEPLKETCRLGRVMSVWCQSLGYRFCRLLHDAYIFIHHIIISWHFIDISMRRHGRPCTRSIVDMGSPPQPENREEPLKETCRSGCAVSFPHKKTWFNLINKKEISNIYNWWRLIRSNSWLIESEIMLDSR